MYKAQAILITKLQHIAQTSDSPLVKAVVSEALKHASTDTEVLSFFANLREHGCVSGMVSSLISYSDTHRFFDEHYAEIENLRQSHEEAGILVPLDGDLKNSLAWFAFEETAYQLYLKLESPQ